MTEYKSLKYISTIFGLSEAYLRRLIHRRLLDYKFGENQQYLIPDYSFPRLKLLSKNKQYQKEIFKEEKHFLYEYHPELKEYLEFHDTIDRFAWLIKLRYADKDMLKSKRFRIDELYQLFLRELKYDPDKLTRNLITKNASRKKFKFHLLQGWYNEISAGYPFSQDFNISSSLDYIEDDSELILFPSWKIIKYYYSVYSFYNSLVFTENSKIKTKEHRKTSLYFNRHQLNKYSKFILKFPFSIYYKKKERKKSFLKIHKKEWDYLYARCPRYPEKTIYELEKDYRNDLVKRFKFDSTGKVADRMTILDILFDFRVWGNYQGIETITELKQGGLLLFLERNLYTIAFFLGGIIELIALAFLGEDNFKSMFSDFYYNYIQDNEMLNEKWYRVPQIVRFRIYRNFSLIRRNPRGFNPPDDDELSFI